MLEGCFECWWCWWMLGGQAGWVADGGNCHHENPTSREVWQSPMLSSWVYHQWLSRILSCRTLLQSPSRSSWSPWQREESGSVRCRRCFLVVSVPLYRRPTARLSFRSAGHRIPFMLFFCPFIQEVFAPSPRLDHNYSINANTSNSHNSIHFNINQRYLKLPN